MKPDDSILFIDTNMYLELFKLVNGTKVKKILEPLNQFKKFIFITQQIVNEIERNKLNMVAALFDTQISNLSADLDLKNSTIPDHLFGLDASEATKLRGELKGLQKNVGDFKQSFITRALDTLHKVMLSEDEISKQLKNIYKHATSHTKADVERAEIRKQIGNPPGKQQDPLGDQLSWEQLLTSIANKKRIWIITRDGDYFTSFGKKNFLNPFLRRELAERGITEVNCFSDLVDGLNDFSEKTGKTTIDLPKGKEADDLKETLRSPISEDARKIAKEEMFRRFLSFSDRLDTKSTLESFLLKPHIDPTSRFSIVRNIPVDDSSYKNAFYAVQDLQKQIEDSGLDAQVKSVQKQIEDSGVLAKLKSVQKQVEDSGVLDQLKSVQKQIEDSGVLDQLKSVQKQIEDSGVDAQLKSIQHQLDQSGAVNDLSEVQKQIASAHVLSRLADIPIPDKPNSKK